MKILQQRGKERLQKVVTYPPSKEIYDVKKGDIVYSPEGAAGVVKKVVHDVFAAFVWGNIQIQMESGELINLFFNQADKLGWRVKG